MEELAHSQEGIPQGDPKGGAKTPKEDRSFGILLEITHTHTHFIDGI